MKYLNAYMKQLEWRRSKVLELLIQGNNQAEISKILKVGTATISRDIFFLRREAKTNIERYVNERLPEEYEKCLVGLTTILKEAWNMSQQVDIENKEKVQALSLAKECYITKMDLLTNVTVVDDAIKFVSRNSQHIKSKNDKKKKIISDYDNNEHIEKEVSDNGKDGSNTNMIVEEDQAINEIF